VAGLVLAATAPLAGAAAVRQRTYATPDEAAAALVAAARGHDAKAILEVLGEDAGPLIHSGDPVRDRNGRDRFVHAYEESHAVTRSGDDKAVLEVGKSEWPFPIPLVRSAAGWRFDAAEGKEEILDRRIGRNELSAVEVCQAYADAQREYHLRNPSGDALPHYAQRFTSTPGKRDGLFWETKPGEEPSPLGPLVTSARGEGYGGKAGGATRAPYHGYYYRILTAQGPGAAGGAYDYVVRGQMIGGFALVAYPAIWDNSGVMTFLVNHDGVVFQKDLGPDTAAIAEAMTTFNPDDTWTRVAPAASSGT
jgi:hypothetical protein